MRDEMFVRHICQAESIQLIVKDFDTKAYAEEKSISIEMAARKMRYDFFEQMRVEHKANAIAVAHHMNDNIETILLNMLRGTGVKGLCGMMPKNGNIIRPLLCVSREEILQYIRTGRMDYVTDSTNLTTEYTRNKIRLELIPMLEEINEAACNNLGMLAENMLETRKIYECYIEEQKSICTSNTKDGFVIDLSRLDKCASIKSVLHSLLSPMGFTRAQIMNMQTALSGKVFYSFGEKRSEEMSDRGQTEIRCQSVVRVKVNGDGRRRLFVSSVSPSTEP